MNKKEELIYPEIVAVHFPDRTLNLLEAKLCSNLGLTEHSQHSSGKNKKNPNCGFVEVTIPRNAFYQDIQFIKNQVKEFYAYRGFKVESEDGLISVKNNDKSYLISVFETSSSYLVSVYENNKIKAFKKSS